MPIATPHIDAVVERYLGPKIVGANVLIARDGELVVNRQEGFLDREAGRPVVPRTLFRMASVTKPIVSVAALSLAETREIRLDDPVTAYLPEFRPRLTDGSAPTITLSQLLTHTSGLSYDLGHPPGHPLAASNGLDHVAFDLAESVRRIGGQTLLFAPGTGWNYSLGIDVLGLVLEVAAGRTLRQIVAERVTLPLGLADTAFEAVDPSRLATAYADGAPPHRMADPELVPDGGGATFFSPGRALDATAFPSGGAGMVGTAEDFLLIMETLRKGGAPLLEPETMKLLTEARTVDLDTPPSGKGYSHGWSIYRDPRVSGAPCRPGTWAWGGIYGNQWYVDPAAGLTIVSFTNTAVEGCNGTFPDALWRAAYADLA
jgi:CubicO group peptidase (beta-lactamase class C family)